MEMRTGRSSQKLQSSPSARSKSKNLKIEWGSILFFIFGVFSFLSLVTYRVQDPSFFTASSDVAQNACGKLGSYFASGLIEILGLASFFVPVAAGMLAAAVYYHETRKSILLRLTGFFIATLSLTILLSLQWKYIGFKGETILTGGAFGLWSSQALQSILNTTGSSLLMLAFFCCAIAYSTPLSVAQLGFAILKVLHKVLLSLATILGAFAYRASLKGAQVALRSAATSIGFLISKLKNKIQKRSKSLAEPLAEKPLTPAVRVETPPPVFESRFQEVVEAPNVLPELAELAAESEVVEHSSNGSESEIVEAEWTAAPPSVGVNALEKSSQVIPEIIPVEEDIKNPPIAKKIKPKRKGDWKLPNTDLLKTPPKVDTTIDKERLIQNSHILKQKFADFGIEGEIVAVRPGPVITLYEFRPGAGIKVSKIAALADDLSMALSAQSVRILAPLPGKSVVGIEIPSDTRETVYMKEFLQHPDFYGSKHTLPVVMGKDIGGQTYLSDLARMPDLLCAGQTGSGKSVFMNGLICSLFFRFTPDELRMILVDPKFIEFRAYQEMPHLLLPVVDDPEKCEYGLKMGSSRDGTTLIEFWLS